MHPFTPWSLKVYNCLLYYSHYALPGDERQTQPVSDGLTCWEPVDHEPKTHMHSISHLAKSKREFGTEHYHMPASQLVKPLCYFFQFKNSYIFDELTFVLHAFPPAVIFSTFVLYAFPLGVSRLSFCNIVCLYNVKWVVQVAFLV